MEKKSSLKTVVENNFIAPLYPGLQISGMTNGAGYKFGFSCSVIPQCRNAGYSKRNQSGFTLIELLVVVLIIGILAAVALPQYQKAVWKSRSTQLFTLVKSVATAQEAYFLANGDYAGSFGELDLSFDNLAPAESSDFNLSVQSTDAVRSNDWFELALNNGTTFSLSTALFKTGPYRGAGFYFMERHSYPLSKKIYCAELIARVETAGSFCTKVWGSPSLAYTGSAVRYYELP